jgi:hypothetical protein
MLAVTVIGGGVSTALVLQQQASAFQYMCDSNINTTCMQQGLHYSAEPDKTPFILPFP